MCLPKYTRKRINVINIIQPIRLIGKKVPVPITLAPSAEEEVLLLLFGALVSVLVILEGVFGMVFDAPPFTTEVVALPVVVKFMVTP